METNSVTVVNATEEFLRSEITKRDERIQSLEEHVQRVTQRDYTTAGTLQAMRDGLHEWTMENLENGSINEEQANELSDIGGFELTKEVEAEVTVRYWITVQVPAGEDAESIINDIDFDAISYDTDTITHVSSSVDSVDF